MAYTSQLAEVVAAQLRRLTTLNRHQLAGHAANLDFWVGEVRHCLDVLDGYWPRFRRLKDAQAAYVTRHGTLEYRRDEPSLTSKAAPPTPVPDHELREARQAVCEAAYRFLVRCFNEGLVDELELRQACDRLEIGVEKGDLKSQGGAGRGTPSN